MSAIPEFDYHRAKAGRSVQAEEPRHHPDCVSCCAMNRCHWCLNRPESGTILSTGPDGYVYSACRTHLQYFREMQGRSTPNAGLDLRAGLEHLDIAVPSPLTR